MDKEHQALSCREKAGRKKKLITVGDLIPELWLTGSHPSQPS